MGNTITLKKSVVPGKIPTTSDLQLGEVSINHADQVFHARHPQSGTVQQIGAKAVHTHVLTDITDLGDLAVDADWNDITNKPPVSATYYGTTEPDPTQYKAWLRTDIGRLFHRYDDTWVEFSQTTIYYTGSTGSNSGNLADITNGLVFHLDSANTASYSGSGTVWNDISGSGYTATLVNGVSVSGGNMTFDGANDYVSTNFDQSLGAFTVVVWFRPFDGNMDWARIVDKDYLTGFWLGKNGNTTAWGGGVVNGTTYRPEQTAFSSIVNNTWNFIAFSREASLLTSYYNGTSNPVIVSCSSASTSTTPVKIGANALTNGENFKGQIPVVRIYNRALSTLEVGQLFNAGKSRFGL